MFYWRRSPSRLRVGYFVDCGVGKDDRPDLGGDFSFTRVLVEHGSANLVAGRHQARV